MVLRGAGIVLKLGCAHVAPDVGGQDSRGKAWVFNGERLNGYAADSVESLLVTSPSSVR